MDPLTAAIEAVQQATTDAEDWLPRAMCLGLLRAYDARWRSLQANVELEAVENERSARLVNPATMKPSRTFHLAGKIDKLARVDGSLLIVDHKTTSSEIDGEAVYWRQMAIESQPSHYDLLLRSCGVKTDGILWDVVRKPMHRPSKISEALRRQVASLGRYFEEPVSQETQAYVVNAERENEELFTIRLAGVVAAESDKYFQRRGVARTTAEIADYWEKVWHLSQDMLATRRENRHYRNPAACLEFGTPCEYLGICSGFDTTESDKWERSSRFPELSQIDQSGEWLTNSRLRVYQTCKRKHYYRYELGIRRREEEKSEALYFGSLWHLAMDSWWQAFKTGETDGNCNEST